jgi:4-hydroxy-4-methyl-2-oxoglutarate aldolase
VQDTRFERLAGRLSRLHTALVSDALDALGHRSGVMDYRVRAVTAPERLVGRAFTLASAPIDEPERVPYEKLIGAYPGIREGDVLVLATNGELRSAIWGELLSVAARARGATGAVTDGLTRDVEGISAMRFPVFARGVSPLDSAGRQAVTSHGKPVVCGGVEVRPGDLILGDAQGVVVIPDELAEDAVALAEGKRDGEDVVRDELEQGREIGEVFARHGIL